MHRTLLVLIWVALAPAWAGGAIYFVNSQSGNDRFDGRSPEQPWQTLSAVNGHKFAGGDWVLFAAGSRYEDRLLIDTPGVRFDMYGPGALPRIDAGGSFPEAVLVHNADACLIRNLEITNTGPQREAGRVGVRVLSDGGAAMRGVRLADLFVHDVNGDLRKSREGCGIFFESRGRGSRFDGLVIERCHLKTTDRNGVCQRCGRGATRSTGVIIRQNLLEDIGGDGIKVWGSDGAIVEKNLLRGGRMRCEDAAAGIWPFDSDNTTIQYNEVSGMKGTRDGQAFDSDYRCRGTIVQYNYSHDNDGGFLLICAPRVSYCEVTIVRYNISQNDGTRAGRIIQIGGVPTATRIYNNTIYVGPGRELPLVWFNEWNGGWADDTGFYNNIFYVEGKVSYRFGNDRGTLFEHNLFYGAHENRPPDTAALTVRPPIANPGGAAEGFNSLTAYRWTAGTASWPARAGLANQGWDLFGTPIPTGSPPNVCASEPKRTSDSGGAAQDRSP